MAGAGTLQETRGSEDTASGMPQVEGVLLTADYITVEGRAWVRLWLTDGERARSVVDPSFEPYFYAVPSPGKDARQLAEELHDVEAGGASPHRAEVATCWEGLEEVEVVRVIAVHPGDVPALREKIRAHEGVASTREDDVLFANRYLVDRDLKPLTWTRFTVQEGGNQPGLPEVLDWSQDPDHPFDLHLLAFDLEVHNPRVTPDAKRDPILVISLADNRGHEATLVKENGEDDSKIIERFVQRVRDLDPDVFVTYNGDNFDWPYLVDRAEAHGIELPLGRDGSAPDIRQAGRDKAVRVTGRGNVDGYQMARRDLPEVKVKTLERVAEHLGIQDEAERTNLDARNMAQLWDSGEHREEIIAFALDDARSTLGIAQELLGLQIGLARRTYQDLSDETRMGRGRQADWFLLAEAHRRGVLAPDKRDGQTEGSAQFEGGVVLEPPAGIHHDVVYLDFSSMYPSIMVAHNVSPDTYLPPGTSYDGEVHEAPEVGHRFRAEPDGFFKRILDELIETRAGLKEHMAGLPADAPGYRALKVEEQAVKVLTNSFYGYMGWQGARWQSVPCAEATTAWGRHFIQLVADRARERDLTVLYGDTDSCMVLDDPQVPAFVEAINEELPIELEVEDRFEVLFFTGAKKRYAGRTADGRTVIRGLEVRRGDWCQYAKDVQQRVIDALLTTEDPEEATRIAIEAVADLQEGRVPLEELTIYKTLTMDPGKYKGKMPHALAVEKAQEQAPDFQAPVGAKIGYVIVEDGSDLVSERARLVDFVGEEEQVDSEYYIENQVMPAALRVLAYFGATENELRGRPKQSSLGEWF
ncbi:MAG: DNA-directed DNA polymerase [Candidatus Thermoplasmatota archaeon]|nr:DNA-directed DNA polymerase [Candidatus Thermoplasmatota archaeon]